MATSTGTHWKKILYEIYKFAPNLLGDTPKCRYKDDNHQLAKKLGISGRDLELGIMFLEDNKLIETIHVNNNENDSQWILTEKGFNIVLEEEREVKKGKHDMLLVDATIVVALSAAIGILLNLFNLAYEMDVQGGSILIKIFCMICFLILTLFFGFFLFEKATNLIVKKR